MAQRAERPEPRRIVSRRRAAVALVGAGIAAGLLYGLLPQLAGVEETWQRVRDGETTWLVAAALFEIPSFAGYVALFGAVMGEGWFGWRVSLLVTLAGVAATRLLATGGAGGIALTGWVLVRAGRDARQVTVALSAFLVALYSVFMGALVVVGLGLWTGLLPGPSPTPLTLAPAVLGGAVIVAALSLALLRGEEGAAGAVRRAARRLRRVGALLGGGVRRALALLRGREPGLLGAVAWWGFDLATLWACLQAFGEPPAAAPLVMAYFVGMLGNLLPLPGGVGGVDGAMIGALIAFGVTAGLAIVGVLAYRLFAFWLPSLAGVAAYAALLRTMRTWPSPPFSDRRMADR